MVPGIGGQKQIIANQALIISGLQKIESLAGAQASSLASIDTTIKDVVVGGLTSIHGELQTQTNILNKILTQLGGKAVKIKKDKPDDIAIGGSIKQVLNSQTSKGDLMDLAKVLVVLGAGFYAIGKGIGQMAEIKPEAAITFGVVFLTVFAAIATIYQKGNSISLTQAIKVSLVSSMFALAIASVARIFKTIESPSSGQLLTAMAVAAIVGPMTYYMIKAVSGMMEYKNAVDFVGKMATGALTSVATLGALILMPAIALTIVATANALKLMPSSINLNKLVVAVSVALSMYPMIVAFKGIYTVLRGDAFTVLARTASGAWSKRAKLGGGMKTGAGMLSVLPAIGATLAIIPLIALSLVITAWAFKLMPDKIKAVPLAWIVSVSIGLGIFSFAFTRMLTYLEMVSQSKPIMGKDGWGRDMVIGKGKGLALGKVGGAFGMLIGVALSIVATALIFQIFPSNPKAPPIGWVISIGLAMYVFTKSISNIIGAFQGKRGLLNMAISSKMNMPAPTPISPKAMLAATAMLPLLMLGMVGMARMSKGFPSAESMKSPPIGWILTIGLGLFIFGSVLALLINALRGKDTGLTGVIKATKGVKAKSSKMSFRDIAIAGGAMIVLTTSLIGVALASMFFPAEDRFKSPPLDWILKIGIAMYLFTKSLSLLIAVMYGEDRTALTIGKIRGMRGKKRRMGAGDVLLATTLMVALAVGMVAVSYATMLFPPEQAFKSPPLGWILKMGIAMYLFTKSLSLILSVIYGQSKTSLIPGERLGARKMGIRDVMFATLMMLSIASAIVMISFITRLLPSSFKAPPLLWTIQMGIAMFLFTVSASMILKAMNTRGVGFKDILVATLAMGAIAAGIVLISYITMGFPAEDSFKAAPLWWTFTVGIGMVLFAGAVYLLTKADIDFIEAGQATLTMVAIAGALVAIAWIFNLLPNNYKAPHIEWVLQMGFAMIVFGGIFALVGLVNKKVEDGAQALLFGSVAILAIAAALYIWTRTGSGEDRFTALIQMGLSLAVLGIGLSFIGQLKGPVIKGSLALILAAVPLVIIAGALWVWMKTGTEQERWIALAQMGAAIVGIGAVMAVAGLGPVPLFIAAGALAMSLAVVPILLLAYSLKIWAEAKVTDRTIEQVGVAINSLIGPMSLAGVASPLILLGAVAMGATGVALYSVAKGVKAMAKIGDTGKLFDYSGQVTQGVAGISWLGGGRKMSNLEWMLLSISRSFMLSPVQIAAMGLGAPAIIMAGEALVSIAKGVEAFSKLNINYRKVGTNIEKVLTIVGDEFEKIGKKNQGGFFTDGVIEDGIESVEKVGMVLSSIAKGVQDWANLTYTDPSDPKGIRQMHMTNYMLRTVIPKRIEDVLGVVGTAFSDLGRKNGETNWFHSGLIEKGVKSIHGAGKELFDIAQAVKLFGDFKIKDPTDPKGKKMIDLQKLIDNGTINKRITDVLRVMGDAFSELGAKNGTTNWFHSGNVEKGVQSIQGAGKELYNIADSIQKYASLTFTDPNGNVKIISVKDIGEYDERGILIKEGRIQKNIRAAIFSITGTLGEIGASPDAGEGWWWSGSSNIEMGTKAVMDAGEGIVSIVDFIEAVTKITNIEETKTNLSDLIAIIPNSIVSAWKILEKEDEDGIDKTIELLNTFPNNFANAIEKISRYVSPMEKIAKSIQLMSTSMIDFSLKFNDLNLESLVQVGGIFDSVGTVSKYAADFNTGADISTQIIDGIQDGLQSAVDILQQQVIPRDLLGSTPNYTPAAPVAAKSASYTTDEGQAIIKQLAAIKRQLEELPVRVVNIDHSIGNA